MKKGMDIEIEVMSWHLGNNRIVKVQEFKREIRVDIRCYYCDYNGELCPGKAGMVYELSFHAYIYLHR